MPIQIPGKRNRRGKNLSAKRNVVAVLSLTAMVDLFTVLVVFLLQNYATTGEILEIPEGVSLPIAKAVKDLKPANVIIVSEKEILLNNEKVGNYADIKAQPDWEISLLRKLIEIVIRKGELEKRDLTNRFRNAVEKIKTGDESKVDEVDSYRKITIQADKKIDFLTLKKVMYTATESGIVEINFAVLKTPEN